MVNKVVIALLNIWSLGHFVQWTFVGRFLFRNWWIFFALSIGWEILELYLPYEFVKETWDNKISDLVVNTIGFVIGIRLRYDNPRGCESLEVISTGSNQSKEHEKNDH